MTRNRRFGVLMHITSLPSSEGIGTLGKPAHDFVDFLARVGAGVWQMLPVGPTGGGDSPYQSPSTFAGNPLLIDVNQLYRDGLLDQKPPLFPDGDVDYARVKAVKGALLERAFAGAYAQLEGEVEAFRQQNDWVDDYALFEALGEHFGVPLDEWPDENARMRDKNALTHYRLLLGERMNYHAFVQYLFDRQFEKLRFYAAMHGVKLFGDLPIYVAANSADVWANPTLFKLDDGRRPLKVAGVPPDYFSEDGQLWGNPIYDWKEHKKQNYAWWLNRMRGAQVRFDMLRIDHFIGFANYYAVPYGDPNARGGKWFKGPGMSLFRALEPVLGEVEIVAEDLGVQNPRVVALRKKLGFPGMRVLEFAFGGKADNPHLPGNYKKNTVAYTGTHDNQTVRGWWETAKPKEKKHAQKYLGFAENDDVARAMVGAVAGSRARTCVIPMQDLLGLNGEGRMNVPGTARGNWRWRMAPGAIDRALETYVRALIADSERGE